MEKTAVNPWQWQDDFGFSQALEISGNTRTLICAGQTSISSEGNAMHEGDMAAQMNLSLDNIDAVLKQGSYDWTNIVKLIIYTTDSDLFFENYGLLMERLEGTTPKPAITIAGVKRLVFPELMVEIEVTAMK